MALGRLESKSRNTFHEKESYPRLAEKRLFDRVS